MLTSLVWLSRLFLDKPCTLESRSPHLPEPSGAAEAQDRNAGTLRPFSPARLRSRSKPCRKSSRSKTVDVGFSRRELARSARTATEKPAGRASRTAAMSCQSVASPLESLSTSRSLMSGMNVRNEVKVTSGSGRQAFEDEGPCAHDVNRRSDSLLCGCRVEVRDKLSKLSFKFRQGLRHAVSAPVPRRTDPEMPRIPETPSARRFPTGSQRSTAIPAD